MRLPAAATVLLLSTTGCVKDLSSEERLDRETQLSAMERAPDAAELAKLHCDDTAEALAGSRNVNRPETERVMSYIELYTSLTKRNATFETAMNRNPDLSYTAGSEQLVAARENCILQTADVRVEFETYVRELVDVPTVQEIKGGHTVTVARLDFNTLRQAIETLALDDKELLLARVDGAVKRVAAGSAPKQFEEPAPAPTPRAPAPSRRRGR